MMVSVDMEEALLSDDHEGRERPAGILPEMRPCMDQRRGASR
jgi:hypothetical protein